MQAKNLYKQFVAVIAALALLVIAGGLLAPPRSEAASATAQTQQIDRGKLNEAASRASRSARVIDQIMAKPDRAIPRELIDRAHAVAVFPGVFRAALGIGGQGGKGLISRKLADGTWSAPAYYNMTGGSFGPQIGATSTDFVLLIMNEDGLRGLMGDKFTIGVDASVAAGPVGRTAAASTNVTLDAGILSYSRARGLFAGLSLQGVAITPDNNLNRALYTGKTAGEVLTEAAAMPLAQAPAGIRVYPQTIARHSSS